jgi:ferredoxin
MRIVADKRLCSGHARCAATAPGIFEHDDNGYIAFTEKNITDDQLEAARRGIRACPERALKIVADEGS